MKFTLTNIEYKIDKRNEEEYQFSNQDWPTLASDTTKIKNINIRIGVAV